MCLFVQSVTALRVVITSEARDLFSFLSAEKQISLTRPRARSGALVMTIRSAIRARYDFVEKGRQFLRALRALRAFRVSVVNSSRSNYTRFHVHLCP